MHPCNYKNIDSDHFLISFTIKSQEQPIVTKTPVYVYDLSHADMDGLCDHFLNTDFSTCLLSTDIEHVWSNLKLIIHSGMDSFIPKVQLRVHQSPKWFTPEIRHQTKCLKTQRRLNIKHPTRYRQEKIEVIEAQLGKDLLTAKSVYETNLITNYAHTNPSKLFQYTYQLYYE